MLVFFILTLIGSALLLWLGILIFRKTEGVLSGWRPIAIYAFFLAATSLIGIIRTLTESMAVVQSIIIAVLCITVICAAIFLAIGSSNLLSDLGVKPKPSKKAWFIIYALVFLALVLINIPTYSVLWAQRTYTIAMIVFGLGHVAGAINFVRIQRMTKLLPWTFMAIAILFAAFGGLFVPFGGQCCAPDSPFAGVSACTLTMPFAYAIPFGCSIALISVAKVAYICLVLGTYILALSLFLSCRKFFGMFKKA